jgi:hypothetical protein
MMHNVGFGAPVQRFSVSSLFFAVNVSPALLQSHRNPIHAAAPFPVRKAGTARASIF